MRNFIIISFSAAYFAATMAIGQDAGQAQSLVTGALTFIKDNGIAKAIEEFNKSEGEFTKGSTYIFVIKNDGLMLANQGDPATVGKNEFDMKDISGKYPVREIIEKAKSGGGFVSYHWRNPVTQEIGCKTSYVKSVDDQHVIGSGFYHSVSSDGKCAN